MRKLKILPSGILSAAVSLALVFAVFGIGTAIAQEACIEVESQAADAPAPQMQTFEWLDEPPELTAEQRAQLERGMQLTHRPGPALNYNNANPAGGPIPGTESVVADERTRAGAPMVPGDFTFFYNRVPWGMVPATYNSNVMESSFGQGGKVYFTVGNWFALRSLYGGWSWQYINPYSDFADFCCDQKALYDESRNAILWLRMGIPDGNGENVFKLGVSTNGGGTWCTWTFAPTAVNGAWTNQWWDYPAGFLMGADYLYLSWNMFDQGGSWTRSVMLRFPLDDLASCTGFSYNYYATSDYFTLVPVSGAYHTMYFASNWPSSAPQNDNLRIWRWDEDSTGLGYWTRTVTAWTLTARGDATCGSPNWAARYDQRIMTGARYSIYSDGIAEGRQRGRKIVAWWWNVAEGGSFSYPYVDAAAFYEDTMTQLTGYLGRPYVWGSWCFAYPSIAPNKRQDLGMVINYANSSSSWRPHVGCSLADDYETAPPGWLIQYVRYSGALPSDEKWGDYNTCRDFEPTQKVWVGASHFIPGDTNCSVCSQPAYFVFGRERDYKSWYRWQQK